MMSPKPAKPASKLAVLLAISCILALSLIEGGCDLFYRIPAPRITGPDSTWTNMPVRFYAYEPDGSPVYDLQQSWTWGDGTFSRSAVHVYRSPGTYIITCTKAVPGMPEKFIPDRASDPSAPCTLRVLADFQTYPDTVTDTIPVGSGSPEWIAGLPDGSRLYVTNSGTNCVSVIDTHVDSVVKTISVQSSPKRCVCSSNGKSVFVAYAGVSSISVIGTAGDSLVSTIQTSANPGALALLPGDSILYVGHENEGFISVLRTDDGAVVDTVVLGDKLSSLAVKPDGQAVYAAAGSRILVVRTSDNTVIATVPAYSAPGDMVFSPNGETVYVALPALDSIIQLRTSDYVRIGQMACGDHQLNAPCRLAMSPDGTYFHLLAGRRWLAGIVRRSDNLLVRLSLVGSYAYATGPQMLWPHPDGARVYAPSPQGVLVLRPHTWE